MSTNTPLRDESEEYRNKKERYDHLKRKFDSGFDKWTPSEYRTAVNEFKDLRAWLMAHFAKQ